MENKNLEQQRIDVLEDILVRLHRGADPDSVQDDFEEHFSEVSAIEIAAMEQQIIFDHGEVTYEDVLKLCNVHARTFENNIQDGNGYEIDHPGHPVRVFKDENLALQATLLRIYNILNALEADPEAAMVEGVYQGLSNQFNILGQFEKHYERKEKLFFPFLEKKNYQAPPKVMWAKDDEIRELFYTTKKAADNLPESSLEDVRAKFEAFEFEFKEMIFKEETILINILLDSLDRAEWYQIAQESGTYGYAIINPPTEVWEPELEEEEVVEVETVEVAAKPETVITPAPPVSTETHLESKEVQFQGGTVTLTLKQNMDGQVLDRNQLHTTSGGDLSLNNIQALMDYMPQEVTVIALDESIQYVNQPNGIRSINYGLDDLFDAEEATAIRKQLQLVQDQPENKLLREITDSGYEISYQALYDTNEVLTGLVVLKEDIKPFRELEGGLKRKFRPLEEVDDEIIYSSVIARTSMSVVDEFPGIETQKIKISGAELMISFEKNAPQQKDSSIDRDVLIDFHEGQLSLNQIEYIFNALPFEVTYVNAERIFKYFNQAIPHADMIFKRSPVQLDRELQFCHPPNIWPRVNELVNDLEAKRRREENLWFEQVSHNRFVHVRYLGMFDSSGAFIGIFEQVRNIKPYF